MSERIYMVNAGRLTPLDEQPYLDEDDFQALLEQHPDLLAGEQMAPGNPRRWLLVSREIAVPDQEGGSGRWSLDHLFLDQDGVPTLVEVKRSADTRIRREVVGQMMDYAANAILHWPVAGIRSAFEATCAVRGIQEPESELTDRLGIEDPDRFWTAVETNLRAKNIRLLFVADSIPVELRRIIEFLNEVMSPTEVLGVELKQFRNGEVRTVVPRVVGQTAAAQQAKSGSARRAGWTREQIRAWMAEQPDSPEIRAYRRLFEFVERHADGMSTGSGQRPGFGCRIDLDGKQVSCWTVRSHGAGGPFRLEIGFGYLARQQPGAPDLEQRFLRSLKSRDGVFSGIEVGGGYPTLELSACADSDLQHLEECTLQLKPRDDLTGSM